jgi:hypothetical protein
MAAVVGLVGTVKKPSVVCEAFSSRGGNPRSLRISISGVSFHKPLRFFFASFLSLWNPTVFHREISRQDALGTTQARSVDL